MHLWNQYSIDLSFFFEIGRVVVKSEMNCCICSISIALSIFFLGSTKATMMLETMGFVALMGWRNKKCFVYCKKE